MGAKEFERPFSMRGITTKVKTPHGSMFVTINFYEREAKEVFVVVSKPGSEIRACAEALGRVISLALQKGIPAEDVVETLENIKTEEVSWNRIDGRSFPVSSIPDGIAKAMKFAISLKHPPDTLVNYSISYKEKSEKDEEKSKSNGADETTEDKLKNIGGKEMQSDADKKGADSKKTSGVESDEIRYEAGNSKVLKTEEKLSRRKKGNTPSSRSNAGIEISGGLGITESRFSICPKCHSKSLSFQEGCYICMSCGYTKCS